MNSQEYLLTHGLDKEFVEKEFGWKIADTAIAMPTKDKNGKVIHSCYRHLEETTDEDNPVSKFKRDLDAKPALYGVDRISDIEEVVYCEGQPDCVRLWQEGIPAVTSDGGAESFTKHMAAQLKGKIVTLCMDSDEAGQKVVEKYYLLLSKYAKSVRILDIPDEYKDVTEVFQAGCDADLFRKFIAEAYTSLDAWALANAPEEYAVESLSSLLKANMPQEQWIIDKLVPISGFSVIAGEEATGKSFYALSMAKSAVTGEPWLGMFEVQKKVKVLFIDKENERVIAQDRARGLKMEECGDSIFRIVRPHNFSFENEEYSKENPDKYSEFAKHIERFVRINGIQLIILDSFIDFMNGDENSAQQCNIFFKLLRGLLPDKSIMFLSHYTKPYKGVVRTPAQMISGSHVISAQITSGIAVTRGDANNEFIIQSMKPRNAINDKTKYRVTLHSSKDPQDPKKTLVTGIQFDSVVEDGAVQLNAAIGLIERLLNEAGEAGVSRTEIVEACTDAGISGRTVDDAKKAILKTNRYEQGKVGHKVFIFPVKTPKVREFRED